MDALPTFEARIYVSGPLPVIEQACREYCQTGLCVTVEPVRFIYTGGEETGAVVGLRQYPKFPKAETDLVEKALGLAKHIVAKAYQKTAMIVTPETTYWIH